VIKPEIPVRVLPCFAPQLASAGATAIHSHEAIPNQPENANRAPALFTGRH
jgi:hypothetical protein